MTCGEDRRIPDTWRTDLLRWSGLILLAAAIIAVVIWLIAPTAMYLISEWAFQ
jgi:multisubunit Na+/H+ antiporter MnhG subunit